LLEDQGDRPVREAGGVPSRVGLRLLGQLQQVVELRRGHVVHGEEVPGHRRAVYPGVQRFLKLGRLAQPLRSSPPSSATFASIAATARAASSSVSVRSGARTSTANASDFRPAGSGGPVYTSNSVA